MTLREFLLKLAKDIDTAGRAQQQTIRILQGRCPNCGVDVSPASDSHLCKACQEKTENETF